MENASVTYQARQIKRRRRTKAQVEQLDDQIVEVLEEDHPQSVRHVYYRMTNPRLPEPVDKTENGYQQVQHRITLLRRSGRVPYGWITDATRRGYHTDTFTDSSDFLDRVMGLYRADIWRDAGVYVEVWCESRSIAGVIEDDCERLAVSLYPAGGFTSITLAYQAAEYINAATSYGDKPAHVIYIGDHDPAGVLIDKSLEAELRKHLDQDIDFTFHRIAITPEQITEYDLPTKPRKTTDRRCLHITETVEAEAMPANILRAMLREKIEEFLPTHALEVAKVAEESEREHLERWVSIMSSHDSEEVEGLLYQ
jgi:hypothetical protein